MACSSHTMPAVPSWLKSTGQVQVIGEQQGQELAEVVALALRAEISRDRSSYSIVTVTWHRFCLWDGHKQRLEVDAGAHRQATAL